MLVLRRSSMERLRFVDVRGESPHDSLCDTVYQGLSATPKRLPPRLFYDHDGSAIFEEITDLPEYYPTRTEQAILEAHADEIVRSMGDAIDMIEFGSGSSRKTRVLIEAALRRQKRLNYAPIDISRAFLHETAKTLLDDYEGLSITAVAGEYFDAALNLPRSSCPRLILFLGSNIGNLAADEAVEFLTRVRRAMEPEDRLLIGTDVVKEVGVLEAAYNDAQGVTARFNLNVLRRINAELGGSFDLAQFRHRAPYDREEQRIEMRLVSLCDQRVYVEAVDTEFEFAQGETIVTEWSQKYTRESFAALAEPAGLRIDRSWSDEKGWFTEYLLCPA
ncbi:L-histidine N(alpha)-methyltransferase [bacterium]|nr:MAG: L-histidine N(alpha)-methyltransferase [bacterium]